ncbi:MAG: DNA-binding protein WhiA [Eubacteriales bacterium]|nr:DNA-binding protein WhiA [Eubacteriales bacterium]
MLPTAECIAGATVFDLVGDEASSYAARLIDTVYHVSATFSNRRGGGGARRVCFSSKAAEKLLTEASHDGFETDKRFKCPLCAQYFFRGLFLSCGMMCDPTSELRMEFTPKLRADILLHTFRGVGVLPLTAMRAGRTVLYFRSGTALLDMLGQMQLLDAMYALSDTLIIRDLKNQETRSTNCIVKNLRTSSAARAEQLTAIRRLQEKNLLSGLTDDLRRTALLLLENSDDSLAMLAMKSNPPVTKSGIYHRLLKIMEYAKEMQV